MDPRPLIDICTHIRYDFETQKWTDGIYLDQNDFKLKWQNKFKGIWLANPGTVTIMWILKE